MRLTLALLVALTCGCKRPPPAPHETGTPTGHDGQVGTVARKLPAPTPTPTPTPPAPTPSPTPAAAGLLRVYIAGESIERWNRFTKAPFTDAGLVSNPADNSDDEYGWMVPFANRLHRRAPELTVAWVGSGTWSDYDDQPYSGSYPSRTAPASSSIAGSSIDSWIEQRHRELEQRTLCYDIAIAARGGNDFGLENDADVEASLRQLLDLLAHGSSCRKDPIIYVTGHPPDEQRSEGAGPDDPTYAGQQQHRYVERMRAATEAAAKAGLRVRFVDLYTPFLENRPTTGFPKPAWTKGRTADFAKIGRTNDRMHPRRLASIYCGELAADGLDLAELRALLAAR